MDCVDIARLSSARERQTTARWQKQVFVHTRLSRAYLALARLSHFIDCFLLLRFVAFLSIDKASILDSSFALATAWLTRRGINRNMFCVSPAFLERLRSQIWWKPELRPLSLKGNLHGLFKNNNSSKRKANQESLWDRRDVSACPFLCRVLWAAIGKQRQKI